MPQSWSLAGVTLQEDLPGLHAEDVASRLVALTKYSRAVLCVVVWPKLVLCCSGGRMAGHIDATLLVPRGCHPEWGTGQDYKQKMWLADLWLTTPPSLSSACHSAP
jgi:hypothetical protein